MNIMKYALDSVTLRLANGMRVSPFHDLTEAEKEYVRHEIRMIGADESKFIFENVNHRTGYDPLNDIVYIAGDVLPDTKSASTHTRDLMSVRAVLAHEYYGHRPHRQEYLQDEEQGYYTIPRWKDEYRASYEAARYCPNLSEMDIYHLLQDAVDRAQEAGYSMKNDGFMQEVFYGYSGEGEYYTEQPGTREDYGDNPGITIPGE